MTLSQNVRTRLLACDRRQSVLQRRGAQEHQVESYSPYGHQSLGSGALGFNGEYLEPGTGHYLLGNGYRAYNPVLMRFNRPDSWSPFGRGGLNAYAYCVGDPVNRSDPTGHFSWWSLIGAAGFGLSVLTMGAATPIGVAGALLGAANTAVDVGRLENKGGLGWVGPTLGLLSVGVGTVLGARWLWNRLGSRAGALASGDDVLELSALERLPDVVMRDIVKNLIGDDLVNLALTSRAMRRNVTENLTPLWPTAAKEDFNTLRRVVLGYEPGHLPAQVIQNPAYRNAALEFPLVVQQRWVPYSDMTSAQFTSTPYHRRTVFQRFAAEKNLLRRRMGSPFYRPFWQYFY